MPISYEVDAPSQLMVVTLHGVVTTEDIRAIQSALSSGPAFEPGFSQLLDLRGITRMDLSTSDVRRSADASPLKEVRRAFVVEEDFHFGLVRQFGVFRDGVDEVRVFRDIAKARGWLGLD